MSIGPLQIPGSAQSPRAATYRPLDFNQTAGASVRLVMDVGAWDNSRAVNTPGQSGDPFSPHYRDLFPLWATGGLHPARLQPRGGRSGRRTSGRADAGEVSR